MLSVQEPGSEVWLSPARNPGRKLRYTWELIRVGKTLVGINTALPNAIVAEAIADGRIPELAGYGEIRREVKYGRNSRIDILLQGQDGPDCYVEVKNVTMRRDLCTSGAVEFPDAVTVRGSKHLGELADMVASGARAVMMYLVQREDGDAFSIAGDIDPAYMKNLKTAMKAGVEALCYRCKVSTKGVRVAEPLTLAL